MRFFEIIIAVSTYYYCCDAQGYVPGYVSCGVTACDVLSMVREEIAEKRYDAQLWEFKEKLEVVKSLEYKFSDLSIEFSTMSFEFEDFKPEFQEFKQEFEEFKKFMAHNHKPESLLADPGSSDIKGSDHDERITQIEEKLEKSLDQIELIQSLKSEIESLKKEIEISKEMNKNFIKENEERVKHLQKENSLRIRDVDELKKLLIYSQNKSSSEMERRVEELDDVQSFFQNQLDRHIKSSAVGRKGLEQRIGDLVNETREELADFKMAVMVYNNVTAGEVDNKISDVSDQVIALQEEIWSIQHSLEERDVNLLKVMTEKVERIEDSLKVRDENLLKVLTEKVERIEVEVVKVVNSSKEFEEETDKLLVKMQKESEDEIFDLHSDLELVKKEVNNNTVVRKQVQTELKVVSKRTQNVEEVADELGKKLGTAQDQIDHLIKTSNHLVMDDNGGNRFDQPAYITSSDSRRESCVYHQKANVIASVNGRPIKTTVKTMPDGTIVYFRCKDPGGYRIQPNMFSQCSNGNWTPSLPTCGKLHSDEGNGILVFDEVPAIKIEPPPNSDSTGILPNGSFVVRPGSKVIVSCHFQSSPKTAKMSKQKGSNQEIQLQGKWNDDKTQFQRTITDANSLDDSANYTCTNGGWDSHSVEILVESVHCPLSIGEELGVVKKKNNNMNAEYELQCTQLNHKLAWPTSEFYDYSDHYRNNVTNNKIKCLPSGVWSRDLPDCEPKSANP